MTKQEIEQAAKEWADNFDSYDPTFAGIKRMTAEISYRKGAEVLNERQPYSAEDFKSFLYWFVAVKGYHLNYLKYYRGDTIGFYTPDELIKNWKVWKEEQK